MPNIMEMYGPFILIMTILLGLSVGSFLNVCIWRLPRHENICFPSSHCPRCNKAIKWYDNIPVLSWVLLRGKCRNCKEPISIQYPLIEILNAALWVLCVLKFGVSVETIFALIFTSMLIIVAVTDIKSMIIPNEYVIAILGFAIVKLIYTLIFENEKGVGSIVLDFVLGAVVGTALFFALYFLMLKVFHKEGLGGGDIKLTFSVGAVIGWKACLFGIFLSAYIGLLVIIILVILKKFDMKNPFPYGPFLVIGYWVGYLYFNNIFDWYLGIVGI